MTLVANDAHPLYNESNEIPLPRNGGFLAPHCWLRISTASLDAASDERFDDDHILAQGIILDAAADATWKSRSQSAAG